MRAIEELLEKPVENPESVTLFWSEKYLHLNEEYMKYSARAEIAESNCVVFKKLLQCKSAGEIYDITSWMSSVKYIRRYEPYFLRQEGSKKFVEIVELAMRYLVNEFDQELLSLKRFATMYSAAINTNILLILGSDNAKDIQLQENFVDVQKMCVWDHLSCDIKSKYEPMDRDLFTSIKGAMLVDFKSPFKQKWIYAKERSEDNVSSERMWEYLTHWAEIIFPP